MSLSALATGSRSRTKANRSRLRTVLTTLLVGALITACDAPPPEPQQEYSRPIAMMTVGSNSLHLGLRFPGRVRAVQRAELAFNIPGQIVEFAVTEGQTLKAGALIARLDPEAFEGTLAAAKARFEEAKMDYERVNTIWQTSQAVARSEVDKKRTALDVARSTYAAARRDAEDTRLTAPFEGLIVHRYVENFQNVQAKEPVVSLQDVNDLEVVIHVPERVMRRKVKQVTAFAEFEDLPGRRFSLQLKSYSAAADPQTQTYEVVLGLTRPEDINLLPGMSAEVIPVDGGADVDGNLLIPLTAVAADAEGAPSVWRVDPETDRTVRQRVTTGSIQGESIVIVDGLSAGDRIVTAGLSQIRDGMLVRPLD